MKRQGGQLMRPKPHCLQPVVNVREFYKYVLDQQVLLDGTRQKDAKYSLNFGRCSSCIKMWAQQASQAGNRQKSVLFNLCLHSHCCHLVIGFRKMKSFLPIMFFVLNPFYRLVLWWGLDRPVCIWYWISVRIYSDISVLKIIFKYQMPKKPLIVESVTPILSNSCAQVCRWSTFKNVTFLMSANYYLNYDYDNSTIELLFHLLSPKVPLCSQFRGEVSLPVPNLSGFHHRPEEARTVTLLTWIM